MIWSAAITIRPLDIFHPEFGSRVCPGTLLSIRFRRRLESRTAGALSVAEQHEPRCREDV